MSSKWLQGVCRLGVVVLEEKIPYAVIQGVVQASVNRVLVVRTVMFQVLFIAGERAFCQTRRQLCQCLEFPPFALKSVALAERT